MASIVYLKNKKSGTTYAYINNRVWDAEKNSFVYKRSCIGHVDPKTGEIIQNRPKSQKIGYEVKSAGLKILIEEISEKTGLTESLKIAFRDKWASILTCVQYILSEKDSLSHIPQWKNNNETLSDDFSDTNEENLIFTMNPNDRNSFLKIWRKKHNDLEIMYYSASPTRATSAVVSKNYHFNEILDMIEINLGIYLGKSCRLPLYYDRRSSDTITAQDIEQIIENLNETDVTDTEFIISNCYEHSSQFDIISGQEKALLRPTRVSPFFESILNDIKGKIIDSNNYRNIGGKLIFVNKNLKHVNGKAQHIHTYYSPIQAERETGEFLSLIDECHTELNEGNIHPEHSELYDTYFKELYDPNIGAYYEYNSDEIMKINDISGFGFLVSNYVSDSMEAINKFRFTDTIRKLYKNMINEEDHQDYKLYLPKNMENRMFIQFIALIIYTYIDNVLRDSDYSENLTVETVLSEMKNFNVIKTEAKKKPIYSSMTENQEIIFNIFNLKI